MGRRESIARLQERLQSIEPGQKVKVDFFRPQDAEGVARLYLAVYGEDFPIDYVYDPAAIVEANAGPDLHQVVVRTERGEVVGAASLFRSAPGRHIMEAGGLMLLPEYRQGSHGLDLPRLTHKVLPRRLGLWALQGQSVCDHLISQKIVARLGMSPFALELDALPTQTDSAGRESRRTALLSQFEIIEDQPQTIYPPERYAGIIAELYAEPGLDRRHAPGKLPAGQTQAEVGLIAYASLARLEVAVVGNGFRAALAAMEENHPGCHLHQVCLPLTDPGLPLAVEVACARGYFLAGPLPLWRDEDSLLMQKVAGEPDWAGIKLFGKRAQRLLDFIRHDREAVLGQ